MFDKITILLTFADLIPIPFASETYMKLKRKLDIIKTSKDYNQMLRLKDEVEVEIIKLQEEETRKSNIYAGLHLGK